MDHDSGDYEKEMDESEIFTIVDELDASDVSLSFPFNDEHEAVATQNNKQAENRNEQQTEVPIEAQNNEVHIKQEVVEACGSNEAVDLPTTSTSDKDEEVQAESHPYLYLIESFEIPKEQMTVTTVGKCLALDETPLHVIHSRGSLVKLLQTLKSAKEIAVDMQLQTGEYRSSVNIIALSTKDADYLIDALALRSELLLLTELFINPKILKIVYKSSRILATLQEKLHLYMVNMFDVEKAALALSDQPYWSIYSAMNNEYGFSRTKINVTEQRTRPFSANARQHFTSPAHYLYYMYHDYKNKLLFKNPDLYKSILNECREACKKLYQPESELGDLLDEFARRNKCGVEVLTKLFHWRNDVACKVNKTVESVLGKSSMLKISAQLTTEESALMKLSNSAFFKRDMASIVAIIVEAKSKYLVPDKRLKPKANVEQTPLHPAPVKRKPNTPQKKPPKKKAWMEQQFTPRTHPNQFNKHNYVQNVPAQRIQSAPSPSFSSPNPVLLKPSNVPSNAVFQQATSEYVSLINQINRRDREELLQMSLPNLKLANQEMRNSVAFGNNVNKWKTDNGNGRQRRDERRNRQRRSYN